MKQTKMTRSTTSLSRYVAANNILLEEKPFERELFMESFLVENPNILSIGDMEVTDIDVEIPIKAGRGRQGQDGRLDMLVRYNTGTTAALVELKLQTLITDPTTDKKSVLWQLADYLDKIPEIAKEQELEAVSEWIGIIGSDAIDYILADKIVNKGLYYQPAQGEKQGAFTEKKTAGAIRIGAITIRRFTGAGNSYVLTDTYLPIELKQKYVELIYQNERFSGRRVDALVWLINRIGPEKVRSYDIPNKGNLVLTEEEKRSNKYEQFCKPLESGLYINTHGSFNDFMTIIRKLKEHSILIEAEIMTSR